MSWQTVAAALGLLLAAGVVVWYKIRTTSNDEALANDAADQAKKAHDLAEAQLKAKEDIERQTLQNEADKINAQPKGDAKTASALDLLAKFRGLR